MKHNTKRIILLSASTLALAVVAAGAGAFVTNKVMENETPKVASAPRANEISWNGDRQGGNPQEQRVASNCDDNNIIGTVLGGVGGGIIGNQIGSGSGNTVATIGGAVGGAALGNEFIPTDGETCGW